VVELRQEGAAGRSALQAESAVAVEASAATARQLVGLTEQVATLVIQCACACSEPHLTPHNLPFPLS